MKWYGILAFLVLIGVLVGIVIYGMNPDKIDEYIIIPTMIIDMRICETNDNFINLTPDLSPCVIIDNEKSTTNGISKWSGTAEGIIDSKTGIICYGKGALVIDGQCVNP